MPNPILDQIDEINVEYEKDDEVDTKSLEDLNNAIELELYERQGVFGSIADSIEDEFSGE